MKCVKTWKRKACAGLAVSAAATMLMGAVPTYAAGGIDMSTEYPGITVKAGDTVTFSLDFASLDGAGHDIALSAESMPENWSGYFKGGSNQITKVYVEGAVGVDGTTATAVADDLANFSLSIPTDAEAGVYDVELKADAGSGNTDILELEITVTEQEIGESNFTSEYPEQEGATGTSFSFDTTLINNRLTEQSYSLSAAAPDGWQVSFTPSGESTNVASLSVEAETSQGITVSVIPPENVEKGEYTIPLTATSANDTLKNELKVIITGTYGLDMSTTDGRLSCDAYVNEETAVTLTITNTGNVDQTNLNLSSSAPTDWEVRFSESTIETLEAGATKEITAYIKPCENSITGDYVTAISVKSESSSDSAEFRVSVKTSTTWGIAAVAIIAAIVVILGVIFKKYGRR